ncbi:hypothetical protein K438DRAFT_1852479 [Mycena galopus ATCC 62051]|nr:hypothetical protein K438DRAFT_1857942 [Mycena galopus ATCC 62051]KAF8171588.1 hypothetical protein K438DRAFT_1852479 [Mycena galopus ATCC 62051]
MESYARHIDDRERRRHDANEKTHPIQFEVGDLVQAYDPRLDTTHRAERKFVLKWSAPRIVVSRMVNSYTLANLNGTVLKRSFHGNHLRGFVVTPGSRLGDIIGERMPVEKTGLSGEEFE